MKKTVLAIVTILLAACGTAQTSDIQSAKQNAPVETVSLGAGDYLITFAADLPCTTGEFNLEAMTTVTTFIPTISFSAAGHVRDNLIRPMACHQFPAPSLKTEVVSLSTFTHVYAVDMEIVKVEKITRSVKLRVAALPEHTLDAGRYILHLNGTDDCNAGMRVVDKSLFFNEETAEFEEVRLTLGSLIGDDLIRTAVCRPGATLGKTYFAADNKTKVVAPQADTSISLEVIEATEKVDLSSF